MSGIMLILREASYTPSSGGGTQGGNSQGGGTQQPTNPGGGTQQPGTSGPAGNARMADMQQYVVGNSKLDEGGSFQHASGQITVRWIPVADLFSSGCIKLTPKSGTSYLGIAYDSGKSKISVITGAWAWVPDTAHFQIPSGAAYICLAVKNSAVDGGDSTPLSDYFDSITD